jgi:hypothetical protein
VTALSRFSPFCVGLACCGMVLAAAAPAAHETPLAIDLSATVWSGDLDLLVKHRAIRAYSPVQDDVARNLEQAEQAAQ